MITDRERRRAQWLMVGTALDLFAGLVTVTIVMPRWATLEPWQHTVFWWLFWSYLVWTVGFTAVTIWRNRHRTLWTRGHR